jgi:hypothetical protein
MPTPNTIETPESAVGNLAISLGILLSRGFNQDQMACYIESVCVLAYAAKVDRDVLAAFDLSFTKKIVDACWPIDN